MANGSNSLAWRIPRGREAWGHYHPLGCKESDMTEVTQHNFVESYSLIYLQYTNFNFLNPMFFISVFGSGKSLFLQSFITCYFVSPFTTFSLWELEIKRNLWGFPLSSWQLHNYFKNMFMVIYPLLGALLKTTSWYYFQKQFKKVYFQVANDKNI